MMSRKIFISSIIFLLLATITTIYFCNQAVEKTSKGKLYSDAQAIPFNKVGLLLGTSKYILGKRLNPYYRFRIDAAVELIKAGKIKT